MNSRVSQSSTADRLMQMLLLLLVVLPSLAILTLLLFSGINNERVLKEQARVLLKNRTSESVQHAHTFLDNMQDQALLSNSFLKNGVIYATDLEELEEYFIAQLEMQPDIAGMYVSNLEGDFFYVSRSIEIEKGKYRVKNIQRTESEVKTEVWWRGAWPGKSAYAQLADDGFDSRTRPWFVDATQKERMVWTDPYVFFTTKKLGVTVAAPYQDRQGVLQGAIGVDVELTELAKFLSELGVSRYGSSFITSHDGIMVATADMQNTLQHDENNNPELLNIINSNNELAKQAYRTVVNNESSSFQYKGKEYLVESMPLKLSNDIEWYIVSYADKHDFLDEIRKSSKQSYYFAGFVTLLSILLGWFVARKTWRPVLDLEDQANKDQLTGLYNRHYLHKVSKELIADALEQQKPLSVAILDIDRFKPINDTFGHDFGDAIIKYFARRLSHQLREADILSRFGGEEFVLVLPGADAETAKNIVENRSEAMKSRPYRFGGHEAVVTFSAGIAEVSEKLTTFEKVLKAADEALYRAKNSGRDQVVIS